MTDAVRTSTIADPASPVRHSGDLASIGGGLMLLLAIVVAALQPSWMRTTLWLPAIFVLGAATPFIVVGRALHQRAAAWALGSASALAWTTMATIPALTVLGSLVRLRALRGGSQFLWYWVEAWHLVEYVMPTPGYYLLVVLFTTSTILVHQASRASADLDAEDVRRWEKGFGLAFGYAVIVIPLFFALSNAQYNREVVKREEREKLSANASVEVRKTLRRMQVCLYAYVALLPNEGYPASLDALGSGGTGCFDSTVVSDFLAHSRLRYAPTSPDSAGRPTRFWIVAEPMTESALWRQQYYADDDGLVYHADLRGRDDSMIFHRRLPDSPLPPPRQYLQVVDSPVHELAMLQRCLRTMFVATPPFFPMSLDDGTCTRKPWVTLDGELVLPVYSGFQNQTAGGTYSVSYRARRTLTESTAAGYVMELRPMEYGVDGIRSYWTDELGRIHWTREDRAADENDPVVDTCELAQSCEG